MSADIRPFGTTSDGGAVDIVRLRRGQLSLSLLTLGAVLQDVRLAGAPWSLTLGSAQIAAYDHGPMGYNGAIVGPVANRIAGAKAVLDGRMLQFEANEKGKTCLHGGSSGLATRVWQVADAGPAHLTLRIVLADGVGGFPGNRVIDAAFVLGDAADLTLTLSATTDRPTLMNLTNHSYWSLDGKADTAGHVLRVAADHYLAVDEDLIPVGPPEPVDGTRFDLRAGRTLDLTEGFDHNWCLAPARRPLSFAAELTGVSGVRMVLETTEPGLQIYDAARMATAPHPGHAGQPYGPHAGIALETQGWPDAPNRPDFPPVRLEPGQGHAQVTRWRFSRV